MPLLQEYFYNDWERLRVVIGNNFVIPETIDAVTKKALGDFYDADNHYQIYAYEPGEDFLKALQALYA